MTRSPVPPEQIAVQTHAERERLADILGGLGAEQWGAPSLCSGWRVREVVAHLTMPFRTRALSILAGLVRAGFSFNRYADRAARADTRRMSDDELLDTLRRNVGHQWQPPGGGPAAALSHDVIHGLDITEPLGLPAPPPERIALVLAQTRPRNVAYFGVDLAGRRLVATDADVSIGEGEDVFLPAAQVLLTVTGRRPLPDATAGDQP